MTSNKRRSRNSSSNIWFIWTVGADVFPIASNINKIMIQKSLLFYMRKFRFLFLSIWWEKFFFRLLFGFFVYIWQGRILAEHTCAIIRGNWTLRIAQSIHILYNWGILVDSYFFYDCMREYLSSFVASGFFFELAPFRYMCPTRMWTETQIIIIFIYFMLFHLFLLKISIALWKYFIQWFHDDPGKSIKLNGSGIFNAIFSKYYLRRVNAFIGEPTLTSSS